MFCSGGLSTHPSLDHTFAVNASRIALSGASAGGNLAASLALLPQQSSYSIVGLALMYPLLDAATPWPLKLRRAGLEKSWVVLPPWFSSFIIHAYLPPPRDARDPLVSPLLASEAALKRFPATAVVTAEEDYLCAEGVEFARRLEACGVSVRLKTFERVGHGFDLIPIPPGLARTSRNAQATREARDFCADALRGVT